MAVLQTRLALATLELRPVQPGPRQLSLEVAAATGRAKGTTAEVRRPLLLLPLQPLHQLPPVEMLATERAKGRTAAERLLPLRLRLLRRLLLDKDKGAALAISKVAKARMVNSDKAAKDKAKAVDGSVGQSHPGTTRGPRLPTRSS